MAKRLGVQVDVSPLEAAAAKLTAQGVRGATIVRQTLNRTVERGRTFLTRDVTLHLNLRPSYVRDRVELRFSTGTNLRASVVAPKRDILLSRFGARQLTKRRNGKKRNAGISLKVKKSGGREVMPGAFFVTLKNSGAQAIATPAPGRWKTGNRRFEVHYGPSIVQHFRLRMAPIREQTVDWFHRELQRQLQRVVA